LRFGAFFGPGIAKNIYEVAMYILDDDGHSHVVAYAIVPQNILLTSESLRILWKVII